MYLRVLITPRAPELPLDTEQSNAVLRYNENPSWDEINPVKCVSACAKRSIEFEVSSIDLFESIKSKYSSYLLWGYTNQCK